MKGSNANIWPSMSKKVGSLEHLVKNRNKEQISQLFLKDRITLNDLRIKVSKTLENAGKNNVNIISVAVKTTPDNVDNAKGVLMNVKSVAADKLRPVGKVEEYGINNRDEEILISGSNSPAIDMSPERLAEYLEDENCEGLYVRQIYEVIKKTVGDTQVTQPSFIQQDLDKRFKNIRNTIDDMFHAHSNVQEKKIEKKKIDIMVHMGISRRSSDFKFMSIDEFAKQNTHEEINNRYVATDLEDKLNSIEGISLITKLRHYNPKKSGSVGGKIIGSNKNDKVLNANDRLYGVVRDKQNTDVDIEKIQKYFKDDSEAVETIVSHFRTNNLEFTDRNIMEYIEYKGMDLLRRRIQKE